MITVRGTESDVQFKKSDARPGDEWDKWSADRDQLIQNSDSARHTNSYYTGTSDLDANGNWQNVPDYGDVWTPNVPPDWAPYRDGNWLWEPYYGWTWVGYEPWGWAPYHYGRWFRWNARWSWWPGPVYAGYRPLWAPAYVSFFGFGGRIGVGFGSIGWFPIGPCDPFFPWFGFGIRFGFADFFGFRDRFDARRFPGAIGPLRGRFDERFSNARLAEHDSRFVTSARSEQFGHGGSNFRAGISTNEFRDGQMMTGHVPVAPTRESLSPTTRAVNPSTVRNGGQQHFLGSTRPTNSTRGSFGEQSRQMQQALRTNGGPAPSLNRGDGVMTQPNRGVDHSGTSQPPVRTFEGQGQQGQQHTQQPSQTGNNSGGWQRFQPQPNEPARGAAPGNQPVQPRYQGNSQPGNSRPPLNLRRPVVNDRPSSAGGQRTPPPPRNTAPPRYSPPPRSSAPPSRPSGGSSRGNSSRSSHGSSGGGSHGGGSSHHH